MNSIMNLLGSNYIRMVEVLLICISLGGIVLAIFKFFKRIKWLEEENSMIVDKYNRLIDKINGKGSRIFAILDSRKKIDGIVSNIMKHTRSEGASLYIEYPHDRSWLVFLSFISNTDSTMEINRIPFRKSSTSAGKCFDDAETNITDEDDDSLDVNTSADQKTGFQTKRLLEFPIEGEDSKVCAVLQLLNKPSRYTDDDIQTVKELFYKKLQSEIHKFLGLEGFVEGMEIHDTIKSKNRLIIAMDLSNSQKVFQMAKNDIVAIMIIKEYYALVLEYVSKHGGYIENYMGDGILISFNKDESTDILSIIKCTIKIREEFRRLKRIWSKSFNAEEVESIHLRQSIVYGSLNVIDIGKGFNSNYTILGKTVNYAFNNCNVLPRDRSIIVLNNDVKNKIAGKIDLKRIKLLINKDGIDKKVEVFEVN